MPPQLRSLLWYVSAWLGRAESDGKSPRFMVKRVGLEPIKPSSLPSGGMGEEGRAQPREARPRAACEATGCARQRVRPQGVRTRCLGSVQVCVSDFSGRGHQSITARFVFISKGGARRRWRGVCARVGGDTRCARVTLRSLLLLALLLCGLLIGFPLLSSRIRAREGVLGLHVLDRLLYVLESVLLDE